MLARRARSLVTRVTAGAQLQSRRRWLSSASAAASDDPAVVCYLDIKSPHAYLILKPALQVQEDYAVRVEFKSYRLDFVEMGISKTRPEDGHSERVSPSVQADRRARMFYAVARDYAALQGIQIRGPYKLLQSRLANLALGYARGESDHNHMKVDVEYLRTVFDAGWPSGWREYDMESADVLKATLSELGADVSGFDEYVQSHTVFDISHGSTHRMPVCRRRYVEPGGEGDQMLAQVAAAAEASGAVGVPHLEWQVEDKKNGGYKTKGMFGREHLSLLRLQLHEQGLARRDDVEPHISHAWEARKLS
jgi:2-hydroxychromene-2-carboxylate isomerase